MSNLYTVEKILMRRTNPATGTTSQTQANLNTKSNGRATPTPSAPGNPSAISSTSQIWSKSSTKVIRISRARVRNLEALTKRARKEDTRRGSERRGRRGAGKEEKERKREKAIAVEMKIV